MNFSEVINETGISRFGLSGEVENSYPCDITSLQDDLLMVENQEDANRTEEEILERENHSLNHQPLMNISTKKMSIKRENQRSKQAKKEKKSKLQDQLRLQNL